MSREIERLIVRLDGDGKLLYGELEKGERATSSFGDKARAGLGIAAGAVKAFAAGATIAVGAAAAVFRSASQDIDRIAKSGARLGIATEKLAGLELAAELGGAGLDSIENGFRRLAKSVDEAAGGTGPAAEAFRRLGVSVGDLTTKSPDEQLALLADKLDAVENPTEKAALALEIFGRRGLDLITIAKGGSQALEAAQKQAERLGLAINEFDAGRVERAVDAMTLLKKASTGTARQFTVAFAPLVEVVATLFVESQGDIREWRNVFEGAADLAQRAIVGVVGAWMRLDSAADFVIGAIIKGWELTIRGAGAFFDAVDFVAKKLGITFAGEVAGSLNSFANEAGALGDEFLESSIKTAGGIDRVTAALDRRITAARKVKGAATPASTVADFDPNAGKKAGTEVDDADRLANELEQLRTSLLSRREAIEHHLEDRLAKLREFRAHELIGELDHAELIASAVNEAQKKRTEIEDAEAAKRKQIAEDERKVKEDAEKKSAAMRISIAQSAASGLNAIGSLIVSAAEENNQGALAAQKGFAIAAIAVNTAIAASRALAELGPIAGPIAAAAIIAGGAASAARVATTSIGGGGRTGTATKPGAGGDGGDVCGAVQAVDRCRGGGRAESDGRLGSGNVFQIVKFGDSDVSELVDSIKRHVDRSDALLFSSGSAQAQEVG